METPVHRICDSFVDDYVRLEPTIATALGIPGYDDKLPDLSPEGHAARAELAATALRDVAALEPVDESERDAKAVFTERLGIEQEIYDAGLTVASLNVLASPAQDLRMAFDLMPTDSPEDWLTIATRMKAMPDAVASYQQSLRHAAERGRVAAARQVSKVAEQCSTWAGHGDESQFFASFVADAKVDDALRADLEAGAAAAGQAYAGLAAFLREELLPKAPAEDAVGADVYGLWSRMFLGAKVDLREAYEWGWA
ncbi:MAG TPA: DUF885 family protein, partial [Actinophytocola sp.]|nr:DUF885 family protein [Actinophytocola sp.]